MIRQPSTLNLHRARLTLIVAAAVASVFPGCGANEQNTTVTHSSPQQQHQKIRIPSDGPLIIEARGSEFKWRFFAAGPDGKPASGDETLLGNELVLPSAAEVLLVLTSEDYVYTLNVPDGRIQAAVPQMVHTLRFVAPTSGTHEFRTDPLCGLRYFHDEVLGTMRIASSEEAARIYTREAG